MTKNLTYFHSDLTSHSNLPFKVWQTQTESINENNLYGTFNLGLHVQDNPKNVHHNRAKLLQAIQTEAPQIQQIHWLNQVHGDKVIAPDLVLEVTAKSADALITSNPHIALAIMTADCVPIMIASAEGEVIGAIHAGWQGLAKGIIAKTIKAMQEKASDKNTLNWQAWVGACIAREHYEVDERVRNQVLNQLTQQLASKNQTLSDQEKNRFFTPQAQKQGHYLADLPAITQFQLQLGGIHSDNIHLSGMDSYGEVRFYSYRQQTEQQLPFTGRMATLIFKH